MVSVMILVPVPLLSACYRVSEYSGDGHLVDNGFFAATDRYVLNLGPIDLTHRRATTFQIANLPETNFVVGLQISVGPEHRATIEKQLVNPIVSLELSGPGGKILFTKKSRLQEWTWSMPSDADRAFVYWRGEPGTYFSAASKTKYTLTLSVSEPDPSPAKYNVLLLAKSGGWK
jgi:hypothetical protein